MFLQIKDLAEAAQSNNVSQVLAVVLGLVLIAFTYVYRQLAGLYNERVKELIDAAKESKEEVKESRKEVAAKEEEIKKLYERMAAMGIENSAAIKETVTTLEAILFSSDQNDQEVIKRLEEIYNKLTEK